jgi:hypothetical protein
MNDEVEVQKPKKRKKIKKAIKKKVHIAKTNAPKNTAIDNFIDNNHQVSAPAFIEDRDFEDNQDFNDTNFPQEDLFTKKQVILFASIALIVGMILSPLLFNRSKVVRNGLQGVIVNPEVPKGRARCGLAEKAQGCVLYVMNPERQELSAKDFYDLVSQLTGRQRFVIQTGNMRYSNTKIRPGQIAQFNVPPLQ